MKKLLGMMVMVVLGSMVFSGASAQWSNGNVNVRFSVPEIAVVDIEPQLSNVEFDIVPSEEAGGAPIVEQVSGESIWINYSSAIRDNGNKRAIKAQISEGTLPEGIAFFIEASAASAFGSANQGITTGRVEVTRDPRSIITGIGSCYTGDGVNMGHELQFSIEITDFTKIQAMGDQVFTVLYTITDN